MTGFSPRQQAILQAAMRVLVRDGYQSLTVDAVAAEAHASKATIYRYWKGKVALIKAALDADDIAFSASVSDTGSLRDDLFSVVKALRNKADTFPLALYAELTQLMAEDGELADALLRHLADEELSPFREPIARAVSRNEIIDNGRHTLVCEVARAVIVQRLQLGGQLDSDFIAQLVDGVLLVLLRAA